MSILTKLFIVLQLVASLALAVLVVVAFKSQEPYKAKLQTTETNLVAAQSAALREKNESAALRTQLTQLSNTLSKDSSAWSAQVTDARSKAVELTVELQSEIAKHAASLNSVTQLTATVNSLKDQIAAKDAELARIRPDNVTLTQKFAELNRANNDLTTQLKLAEQAIRKLQEAIALQGDKPSSSTAGDAKSVLAVQTAVQINGKIGSISTHAGRTYVGLGLGTRDGVKVGTQFAISRGNSYIGDAVVNRATVDESVALITLLKEGKNVQEGDLVTSGIGN